MSVHNTVPTTKHGQDHRRRDAQHGCIACSLCGVHRCMVWVLLIVKWTENAWMKKDPCKPHACNIQKCLKGTCVNGCKTTFAFQENRCMFKEKWKWYFMVPVFVRCNVVRFSWLNLIRNVFCVYYQRRLLVRNQFCSFLLTVFAYLIPRSLCL